MTVERARALPFSWLFDHLGKTHRMVSKMGHRLAGADPVVVTLGKARPPQGVACVPRSALLCFLGPERPLGRPGLLQPSAAHLSLSTASDF